MKIVHVVHDFVPGVGGFQIAVFEIARRQARTHEVEVYSGYPNGRSVKKEIMDNIKVFRFPSYAPNNAYHISFPLYQALKDVEGDILHIYCFLTAIPFLAYLALRQAKNKFKKIIFTPGVQVATTPFRIFLHKLYDPVQKRLFFWADKIICWTEHEKSLIQRQFKVPPTKMHVIPLGLDETKFTQCPAPARIYDFEILYTGRLEKYKNVHQVIYCLPQIIKKYPQKNIHYTIIGDGPYRKKLEKIIAKAGVEKYVSITGFAPSQQELIKSYKRADVFVSVSNTESFGMTIIEALAAGTPVIISDSPPIKHIVNGNGFVLTDLHQLSEKIEYIMTNTINVNFDVEPYTWNSIERQTTQIYF